jgi:hypothetical protein
MFTVRMIFCMQSYQTLKKCFTTCALFQRKSVDSPIITARGGNEAVHQSTNPLSKVIILLATLLRANGKLDATADHCARMYH